MKPLRGIVCLRWGSEGDLVIGIVLLDEVLYNGSRFPQSQIRVVAVDDYGNPEDKARLRIHDPQMVQRLERVLTGH